MTTPYIPQQPWNAECPYCKDPMAYHGFYSCECTTPACRNFSEAQKKSANEYIEYLDKLTKEAEEKNKIAPYYSTTYKSTTDDDDDLEEAHRLAYGTYAMYGTIPDPIDKDNDDSKLLDLDNVYDPSGFYTNCTNSDPCDDPADKQPIPTIFDDDDILDLFGPI